MTNSLDSVLGSTVYGPDEQKIGKVKEIYINNENGSPTWVSVSTGMFSSDSLVPLAGASHSDDSLQVTVDKEAVKSAPYIGAGESITATQERDLLRHYGIDSTSSGWNDYGKHAAGLGADVPAGTAAGSAGGHGRSDEWVTKSGTPDAGRSAHAADEAVSAGEHARATDASATDASALGRHSDDDALVRSEERLKVDTRTQERGTARLRKYVVTEQQTVTVPVSREEVRVVREPISDPARVGTTDLGEESREVTLHEDQVTVAKETVPVEQVRLEVDNIEDTETVTETVRKEQIDTDGIDRDRRRDQPDRPDQPDRRAGSTR